MYEALRAYFVDRRPSAEAAKAFDLFCSLYGAPQMALSDNGPCFVSKFFMEAVRRQGTTLHHTSPHHPQSRGGVERMFRQLAGYIRRCLPNGDVHRWGEVIWKAVQLHNTTPSTETHLAPLEILFGYTPASLGDAQRDLTDLDPINPIDETVTRLLAASTAREKSNRIQLEKDAQRTTTSTSDNARLRRRTPRLAETGEEPGPRPGPGQPREHPRQRPRRNHRRQTRRLKRSDIRRTNLRLKHLPQTNEKTKRTTLHARIAH